MPQSVWRLVGEGERQGGAGGGAGSGLGFRGLGFMIERAVA